jgi:hypothetical protein
MSTSTNTSRIITSGLSIEVERVAAPSTSIQRSARIDVRIRPADSEPGRDTGPKTCLSLEPSDAHAFGVLLQQAAAQAEGGAA